MSYFGFCYLHTKHKYVQTKIWDAKVNPEI